MVPENRVDLLQFQRVGSTELFISEFSFGGACVGEMGDSPIEDRRAETALACAWDAGIRHFDTAPKYGEGTSERRVGRFLSTRPRSEFTISTKVGILLAEPDISGPSRWYDYTYDGIMRSVEQSLERLGLNAVDMLLVHEIGLWNHARTDGERHIKEFLDSGLRAVSDLRSDGAVSAVGLGVNEVEICHTLLPNCDLDILLPAGRYTLLDNSGAVLFDECAKRQVSVFLAGVFNSGVLATGAVPGAQYQYRPATEEILRRTRALSAVCDEFNVPMATAALQFAKHHPAVTSTIVASIEPQQLVNNLAAFDVSIPTALWHRLDEMNLCRHHALNRN